MYYLSFFSSLLIPVITFLLCLTHIFSLSINFRPSFSFIFFWVLAGLLLSKRHYPLVLKPFFHSLVFCLCYFHVLFPGCPDLSPYDLNQPKGKVFSDPLQIYFTLFFSSMLHNLPRVFSASHLLFFDLSFPFLLYYSSSLVSLFLTFPYFFFFFFFHIFLYKSRPSLSGHFFNCSWKISTIFWW